jgi:hypothetical protein
MALAGLAAWFFASYFDPDVISEKVYIEVVVVS